MKLADMTQQVYEVNKANGWRDNPDVPDPDFEEAMMLLITEIAEAADAWRMHGFADATAVIADNSGRAAKPEGAGSEFADILIRFLDDCHVFGWELPAEELVIQVPDPKVRTPFLAAMYRLTAAAMRIKPWRTDKGVHAVYFYNTLIYYASMYGIDLGWEFTRKMAYNRTRGYRHGGKRLLCWPSTRCHHVRSRVTRTGMRAAGTAAGSTACRFMPRTSALAGARSMLSSIPARGGLSSIASSPRRCLPRPEGVPQCACLPTVLARQRLLLPWNGSAGTAIARTRRCAGSTVPSMWRHC